MRCWPASAVAVVLLIQCGGAIAGSTQRSTLDRVASAVDGAESSHGEDAAMWRPDPTGPQGPMQVSAAAATDVGGGDRFDTAKNRAIGRAYLEQLYRRYHNWPDAIAAYNWGIGKVNAWLLAGRPAEKLAKGVAAYTDRVLRDSGLCAGAAQPAGLWQVAERRAGVEFRRRSGGRRRAARQGLVPAACAGFSGRIAHAGAQNGDRLLVGLVSDRFYRELEDQAARDLLAAQQR